MERHLLERMIGAGILLVALVVVVPMVLNGGGRVPDSVLVEDLGRDGARVHIIRPDDPPAGPPVAKELRFSDPSAASRGLSDRPGADESTPESKPPQESPAPASPPGPEPALDAKTPVARSDAKPEPEPAPQPAPRPEPVVEPAPPARPAPSEAPGGFAVQIGAYGEQGNAAKMTSRLQTAGYDAYITLLDRNGTTLHQVRVGGESDREAAAALADELAADGFKGVVVRR